MFNKIFIGLVLFFNMTACTAGASSFNIPTETEHVSIRRFDRTLFRWVQTGDTAVYDSLCIVYPQMLDVLGKAVFNMQSHDLPGFMERVRKYYSEPTLNGLYDDTMKEYTDVSDIEEYLGQGFAFFRANFPNCTIPAVYMHVSGFNQNVLVADSLLSLSADKYLGSEYPLYQQFFYDYQRIKMQRRRCAVDYLAGWLMSEYPFTGNDNVLLDQMVYFGKIQYVVSLALSDIPENELMGYSENSLDWCDKHEGTIWREIIKRKHLYTPDRMTTEKYLEETPCSFLADEAPGNIGTWIGLQIVRHYMKETGSTLTELMAAEDAQQFLNASKYKPE